VYECASCFDPAKQKRESTCVLSCVRVFLGFLPGYPQCMCCFAVQTAGDSWCNNNTTSM